MRHLRKTLVLTLLTCTALTLGACGGSAISPADAYREAIESVPGVDHAEVQYQKDTAMGSNTSIEVFATTNDHDELLQVLNGSIRAYLDETEPDQNSSLHFVVASEDQQTLLGPDAVGVSGNDLRSLREQYTAP